MVNSLAKKITAVAVLVAFLAGGFSPYPLVYADAARPAQTTPMVLDLARFELPAELGSVRGKSQGSGGTVLILEDAHAQPHAQKKIEKILRVLDAHYGVREVLLEGGIGKGDALLFRQFPDRKILRETFDEYLARGELSGSMSAAVFSKSSLQLYGAEKPDLYWGQLMAYLEGLKVQPQRLRQLTEEKQKLQARKQTVYSAELLDLEQSLEIYEKDRMGESRPLAELLETLSRLNPPTEYPLLEMVRQELAQAGNGSEELLRHEIKSLFDALRKQIKSSKDRRVFAESKQAFETQQQEAVQIATELVRWATSKKWKIPVSKSLTLRIEEQRRLTEMKGLEFFAQWNAYVEETLRSQLKDAEAEQVYTDSKELVFLERLIHFELNRADWKRLTAHNQENHGRLGLKFDFEQTALTPYREFYRLAAEREQDFVKKIRQRLRSSTASKTVVFVAGGFHTEGLQEVIQREGFSCAVVTPVFQPSPETDRYEALMRGDVSWRSYFTAANGTVDLKAAFNRAAVDRLIEKQQMAQNKKGRSRGMEGLKDWRDQLIRAVAREGRLKDSGRYTRWIDQAVHSEEGEGELELGLSLEWKERIELFTAGLKQLVDSNQVTEANLAGLFAVPALSTLGEKPFVAIPIPLSVFTAISSEFLSGELSPALPQQEEVAMQNTASRSEIRSLENFEGYRELKSVIQGALNVLEAEYLIPSKTFEIFKTLHIDETLSGAEVVFETEAVPKVRISEELVRAAKDDAAGQRVLARRLARFLDEYAAAQAGTVPAMTAAMGLRLDLFRFLGETTEERERDLLFYKTHAFLQAGEIDFYEAAHKGVQSRAKELAEAHVSEQFVLQDEIRRRMVDEVTEALTTDELFLREEALRRKQLKAQVDAFKIQGFFNGASKDQPEKFWRWASLDFMRELVLEQTKLVRERRHQEVRQKIAEKVGKPLAEVQQPIDFDLQPWQLFVKDFQEVVLGPAGFSLESLYRFLVEGVELPEQLETYTERDQKIGLLLERLGWNEPHRLFDAERMEESQKTEAVSRLIEFLAGDLSAPDEKRGHRWNFETMRFEETDPVAVADLPEANLLTSYWIASQGKNMEVSRYGFLGVDSLRFTTGTLASVHTAFYTRVQLATMLRALRRNPAAQAFSALDRAGGDEAAVKRILGNAESLKQFKEEVSKDPALASQIIFSDDLRHRASSGFLKTNLGEIHAFQNFLKRLLPAVETLQKEEPRLSSRYGAMTETQAVQELGIAGLELKKLHTDFLTESRTYGVLSDGRRALFEQDGKPILAVTVDAEQHVNGIIFYVTDDQGNVVYEDHREILKSGTFHSERNLEEWLALESTLYSQTLRERVFYENERPVFRLKINPGDGTVTEAGTIENALLDETGKHPLSFSVQRHKLVESGYRFDAAHVSAADWLSRSVQVTVMDPEPPETKSKAKEISRKKIEFVRIHSETKKVIGETGEKSEVVVSGIESTHVIGSDEAPQLVGDFFELRKTQMPYSSITKPTAWWSMLDETEEPVYDRETVARRVFYDNEAYETASASARYRPVLELSILEGVYVEGIQSFGYDAEGVKTFMDDHRLTDFMEFDKEAGLDVWQQVNIRQRTFFDAQGHKTLVIEVDPETPGRVLSVKRYREVQRMERGQTAKQFVEILYPEAVLEEMNARSFEADWGAEEWLRLLSPYELLEAGARAEGAFEEARRALLAGYQEKRKLLEQALFYYNQLQRDEIEVSEMWMGPLDKFVEDVLRQGLRPWISEIETRPRDLSRILRRTMNLMRAYGAQMGILKETVSARSQRLTNKVLDSTLWSAEDYSSAAKAVLAGAEAQEVPIQNTGDFSQVITEVMGRYEDQVSPIAAAHERLLRRLGAAPSEYDGNFTALRDESPAMQAAYWAEQYVPAEYGVQRPEESFAHAADNDSASLMFSAEQTLQSSSGTELTDVQADPWLNKLAAWDNAHNPEKPLWNSRRVEVSAENAALQPELHATQDVLYEIYTLNGQQGPKSREAVSQKLYDANQLLKKDGVMVLMLPAHKGLSEEGIEQIQANYGFERVEEGIAFNEFSPEYRTAEMVRQEKNPDQVAEAEDLLQSQKFYVLILRKTSEIAVEKAYLPKNQLAIKTFDAPPQDVQGQVMKSRGVSGEVHLSTSPRIQDLVKDLTPKQLRAAKPQSRVGRTLKQTAIRHTRVDHRKSDERDFPYMAAKLALVQKYRELLLQPETGLKDGAARSRLQSLLNRTYEPALASLPREISKIKNAWTTAQPLWWIEDREPKNSEWPKSKMMVSKEGRQGLSVTLLNGQVTAVWVHTLDGKGRIIYSEPRRLLKADYRVSGENFESLKQLEGTVYASEPDLSAIFTRRRTVYLPVFEAYRDLESLYPAMARYPDLEAWFLDDVWRSLENLTEQEAEDDEMTRLLEPFTENRSFVKGLKAKWKNAEKIEIEEADKLYQLRRMTRNLRTFPQLWGIRYRTGQTGPRKSPFGSDPAEAAMHHRTLYANPSFMSALAVGKYVKHVLDQNNGELVLGDLAAGSGALAKALDKLDVKTPDSQFQFYELDLNPDYLEQKRPARFEAVLGQYYHRVVGDVAELPAAEGFTDGKFDVLTPIFIADFLEPTLLRAMFSEMNRVLKQDGEALLTLPQSWRLTPDYVEALKLLGFEIEVAPMRAAHTATNAWIDSIKAHYGDTTLGNEIAEEVRRMKSKQFSIIRIKKVRNFSGDLESVPLESFRLEKTDTGQRGKTTGDKPFDFSPEAMRRWQEVTKWMIGDWQAEDLEVYDPSAETITREEILAQHFPEIVTEQALERLYGLRAIFSSEQETGNDYESIADFYAYWKAGFQQFRRQDVERLAQLYRRGPPKKGYPPTEISSLDLFRKLESRADYFAALNKGRHADTYEHFERNQILEGQIREKITVLRDFLDRLPRLDPGVILAIPEEQKKRYGFQEQFSPLQSAGFDQTVWSPRLIAGLEWFFNEIHKPGDNAIAAMIEHPPDLPDTVKVLRSEMRTDAVDLDADLELVKSNWALMLRNAVKANKPAENVMRTALHLGLAFQRVHTAGKWPLAGVSGDSLETALAELNQVVPGFEEEWETRYGLPVNLPEDPTDIANALESFRLWRIKPAEIQITDDFVQEWLRGNAETRPELLQRIKAWTGNETDNYTDLRSFNRRLLIWAKMNEQLHSNFELDLYELAAIRAEFRDRFVFDREISQLPPQILLQVLQSIIEAAASNREVSPPMRADLQRLGDGIFSYAVSSGSLHVYQAAGAGGFDMVRLSATSPLYRYTYIYNIDLGKTGPYEEQGDLAMLKGLKNGKWGPFEKLYAKEDRDSRIRRFHKLIQLMDRVRSKEIDLDRFNQLTDRMVQRVTSVIEAGAFFSKAGQWKDPEARRYAQNKIAEKILSMMARPEKREDLYEVLRKSILTTLATGTILWQVEAFLAEEAHRERKQPEKSLFSNGKEKGLVSVFIQEGLKHAEDPALTVGLFSLLTLELDGPQAKPGGSLAGAAQAVKQARDEALFERELLGEIPGMVSALFLAPDEHPEFAKALGQWFYRKQKSMTESERGKLWGLAQHELDLLWVRYTSVHPERTREVLGAIFEAEATGQALPEDPIEAVNYLADQKLWSLSDADLAEAGERVQRIVDAPAAERDALFQEIGAWLDEPVPGDLIDLRAHSRLVAVYARYKSVLEQTRGLTLDEMAATNQILTALVMPRLPFSKNNPSTAVLFLQLLRQAAQDPRLAFGERLRLWFFSEESFRAETEVKTAFKDRFQEISGQSPLKSFSGFMYRKATEAEKQEVAAVWLLFSGAKSDSSAQNLSEIRKKLAALNEVQLRVLLFSVPRDLKAKFSAEKLDQRQTFFMKRLIEEVDRRSNPMAALTALMGAVADDPMLDAAIAVPLFEKFSELLENPEMRRDFLELIRAMPSLGRFFARIPEKYFLSEPSSGRQGLIEILEEEMRSAFAAGEVTLFFGLTAMVSYYHHETERGRIANGRVQALVNGLIRFLTEDALNREAGGQVIFTVSTKDPVRIAILLGELVYGKAGEGGVRSSEIYRRARHLLNLAILNDYDALAAEKEKLYALFDNAAMGLQILPEDPLDAAGYLVQLEAEGQKIWSITPEDHHFVEGKAREFLGSTDPAARGAIVDELKKWREVPEDLLRNKTLSRIYLIYAKLVNLTAMVEESTVSPAESMEAVKEILVVPGLSREQGELSNVLPIHLLTRALTDAGFSSALEQQWIQLLAINFGFFKDAAGHSFSQSLEGVLPASPLSAYELIPAVVGRPFNEEKVQEVLRFFDPKAVSIKNAAIQQEAGREVAKLQSSERRLTQDEFVREIGKKQQAGVRSVMLEQEAKLRELGAADRIEFLRRWPALQGNPRFPESPRDAAARLQWINVSMATTLMLGMMTQAIDSPLEILEIMHAVQGLGAPILSGQAASPLIRRLNERLTSEHGRAEFIQLLSSNQNRAVWIAKSLKWASSFRDVDGHGVINRKSVSPYLSEDSASESALRRVLKEMAVSDNARINYSAQNLIFTYDQFLRDDTGPSNRESAAAQQASQKLRLEVMRQYLDFLFIQPDKAYAGIGFIHSAGLTLIAAEELGLRVQQAAESDKEFARQRARHYLRFYSAMQGHDEATAQKIMQVFNEKSEGAVAVLEDPVPGAEKTAADLSSQHPWAADLLESMKQPLLTLPDEDLAVMQEMIHRMFDPALAPAERAQAKTELTDYIQDSTVGQFRAASRATVVNELMSEHVRNHDGIIYDPEALHAGFTMTVALSNSTDFLQFILLRVQAAKDSRFSFTIRKDITSKLLDHLDAVSSRKILADPVIQAFLKNLPDDSELSWLRLLEVPSAERLPTWQTVPRYPSVMELMGAISAPGLTPVLEAQATNILNELDKLLAVPAQREEFKRLVGQQIFAKFPLLAIMNELQTPGFIGSRSARFPHLGEALDEMLASSDPFTALNALPILTTYAMSVGQREVNVQNAWEFLLGRAVALTQSGRPFHETRSLFMTLALAGRPSELSRTKAAADFLEDLLKMLAARKQAGQPAVFPSGAEMTREIIIFAGTYNVSETELREILQVPEGSPLTHNRFKKILDTVEGESIDDSPLSEPLDLSSLSTNPFTAMQQARRANENRHLWVLRGEDKKEIQRLADEIYQAADDGIRQAAYQRLDSLLTSTNRYQEWSRRTYAYVVLRRGALRGAHGFDVVAGVQQGIPIFVLKTPPGQNVMGRSPAEQIEELQVLIEGASEPGLEPQEQIYFAYLINRSWNHLARVHALNPEFGNFLNEMQESQGPFRLIATTSKNVQVPLGIDPSGGGDAHIRYDHLEDRRYWLFKLAQADYDTLSPIHDKVGEYLDLLIPHLADLQEFTDFFYYYAQHTKNFQGRLSQILRRFDKRLADPAVQDEFLLNMDRLLPLGSLEYVGMDRQTKPLFDSDTDFPNLRQTIERGLQSDRPLLRGQALRLVNNYIGQLYRNVEGFKQSGDEDALALARQAAQRQELFVLDFFERLFHEKGFAIQNYDGLFLIVRPVLSESEPTRVWELIAERAEKAMREELEQVEPSGRAALLAKFDPQKIESLFTGLTGWEDSLKKDDARRILGVAPGEPLSQNRFQRLAGEQTVQAILAAVEKYKDQKLWNLTAEEKSTLSDMVWTYARNPNSEEGRAAAASYAPYLAEVDSTHRYARFLYAIATYERANILVPRAYRKLKQQGANPFADLPVPQQIEDLVATLKLLSEFSQAPEFQGQKYKAYLQEQKYYQSLFLQTNPKILSDERLRIFGEMTGAWFVPPSVGRGILSQQTGLADVRSIPELISYFLRTTLSTTSLESEQLLQHINGLLVDISARRDLLSAIVVSPVFKSRLVREVFKGSSFWNENDSRFQNLKEAFLESAQSKEPRLVVFVRTILGDVADLTELEKKKRSFFVEQFLTQLLPQPFKDAPPWIFHAYRILARYTIDGQPGESNKISFQKRVDDFAQAFKSAHVQGLIIPKEKIDQVVWLLIRIAAFSGLRSRDLQKALGVPRSADVYDDNVFTRLAASQLRSEVRSSPTGMTTRLSLPPEKAEVRSSPTGMTTRLSLPPEKAEVRSSPIVDGEGRTTVSFQPSPSNYQLDSLSKQTAGYLISGRRLPPTAFLTRLGQAAETDFTAFETRLLLLASKPDELAILSLQTREWTDPAFEAGLLAESRMLERQGFVTTVGSGADIVRIFTSIPQTDALIAAMKNQTGLNVYGLWQPESFTDKRSIHAMREQAKLIEYEVNRALGVLDTRARFKLSVPESPWKLERLVKEAPSILMGLKGRRDPSVITNRMVVVHDGSARVDVRALSEHKSLSHQIPAADKNRFAKEYLLYGSAAEISQDVLSQLYRAFIRGEGHYSFQDDLISVDLLSAFVGMERLIAQQFASAA